MSFWVPTRFLKVRFQVSVSVPTKRNFQFLCKLPVEGRISSLKTATPKKFLAFDKRNWLSGFAASKASFKKIKAFLVKL